MARQSWIDIFAYAALPQNIPALLGMLGVWNSTFLGTPSHAVVPYDHRLRRLPDYLQQLIMESNGKRVSAHGEPLDYDTSPVVWGGVGTNVQHAFFQQLHQGTWETSLDFIVAANNPHAPQAHQDMLIANCLAQSQALMRGDIKKPPRSEAANSLDAHKHCPGDHGSTTIMIDTLTPETLGALIAMYEHKTFVEATLWGINPFDQWGVEIGKRLATAVLNRITGEREASQDPSTEALLQRYQRSRPPTP